MGASALYLFGSTAAGTARETSDIDIFIDHDDARRFNAFDLVDLKLYLEEELKKSVDITTRNSLHKALRERIINSSIRVF